MRLRSAAWTPAGSGGTGGRIRVTAAFDPRQLSLEKQGDGYVIDLDLLLLADDDQRNVVGEERVRVRIELSEAELGRTKREWLSYDAVVETMKKPTYLRAVLYNFNLDRTASTQLRMPR